MKVRLSTVIKRSGAWFGALWLVTCLMGCEKPINKAPRLPPPLPPAAQIPRPVRPTLYVSLDQLSLRACPGLDCHKISTLELNTEVEKMGEIEKWTQIKVKKNGTIGYASSRYLSPQPVEIARHTRKKSRKAQVRKAITPPEAAQKEEEEGTTQPEPAPALPRVM